MKRTLFLFCISAFFVCKAQDKKPTETEALLRVTVTNFKNEPRKGETIILKSSETQKEYTGITDANGKCAILLSKGSSYEVKYKEFDQTVDYQQVKVPEQKGLITFDLTLKFEPSRTYTLKNVHYDTGKATLRTESFPALDELVEALRIKETMVIEIAGHTDNVGSADMNMKLSQDRANSVRNYLLKKGIASARVTAKGYGDTQPVADNTTDQGKQMNRRTEVRIIKE